MKFEIEGQKSSPESTMFVALRPSQSFPGGVDVITAYDAIIDGYDSPILTLTVEGKVIMRHKPDGDFHERTYDGHIRSRSENHIVETPLSKSINNLSGRTVATSSATPSPCGSSSVK